MAASRYDRDEFRRLDVKLIFGAVVKLEVLPQGVRADSLHGPHGLNSAYKKSLREIADFKEPMSAPAGEWFPNLCSNLDFARFKPPLSNNKVPYPLRLAGVCN